MVQENHFLVEPEVFGSSRGAFFRPTAMREDGVKGVCLVCVYRILLEKRPSPYAGDRQRGTTEAAATPDPAAST